MRPLVVVAIALCSGCERHEPPAGSGALETTPLSSASAAPAARPEPLSFPRTAAYPNGAVLSVDPVGCRVDNLHEGQLKWSHDFGGCGGLLEASIALNSVAYVRSATSLVSLDVNGATLWTSPLSVAGLPRGLTAPTTLADSRVAVAVSPSKVQVFEQTGAIAWAFSPPSEEVLLASPVGMRTEGLTLLTSQATYLVSASGEIRWRVPRQHGER